MSLRQFLLSLLSVYSRPKYHISFSQYEQRSVNIKNTNSKPTRDAVYASQLLLHFATQHLELQKLKFYGNYYLTLKFKMHCLKSSTFVKYVLLPHPQKKNPQSTAEIPFFKHVCIKKLSATYIVLQVAAKNTQLNLSHTPKNAMDLLQVVNFTNLLQLVNKLQQACQFHQVAISLLRSGLLQFVICRLVTTC